MSNFFRFQLFSALLSAVLAGASQAAEVPIDFNRQVRPVLSKNCFSCHGPDEEGREAGLRLDERESAVTELDSGATAIVPGEPSVSELVARITSDDEYVLMPPPESHLKLKPAEIELLKQWIAEGAPYRKHWSFEPPEKAPLPELKAGGEDVSPIDAFVRAQLEEIGLEPSPEADRRTLIRRLSLDITGLPPSPAEVEAFVDDQRADAYEQLVERLLASPHYGERMTVAWLDAARYADTHGYHIDSHRDMWPWRDWVIEAYNDNLPFDEFTIWQLAGDLLPEPSTAQLVASGFNRNHGINFEGGAIPEEYHVEYVVDRVNTTGTVWLGLTLGCARCHDHKYDPLKQEEYFKFFAFFNTIDELGLDGQRGNAKPILKVPTADQKDRQEKLTVKIEQLKEQIKLWQPRIESAQQAWEKSIVSGELVPAIQDSQWYVLSPIVTELAKEVLATDFVSADGAIDPSQPLQIAGEQRTWTAFPSITDGSLQGFPSERSANYLYRTFTTEKATKATLSLGGTDAIRVWWNGQLLVDRDAPQPLPERQQELEVELQPGENRLLVKVVNISWECDFYFALRTGQPRLPGEIKRIVATDQQSRSNDENHKLQIFFRENIYDSSEYQALRTALLAEQRELAELGEKITTTMVMHEMTEPRNTYRLDRGQYDSPREQVQPMTFASLPPLETSGSANRLDLANWLVSPDNPLTARVTVNRLWQQVFGTGLVLTAEDFGTQGEWPSHPQLLDWLAVEFVESGWDVKHMLRLIFHSQTYRQSSAATPEKLEADPRNRLLSRGPRFRLQAEFVRDLALKTGGLLNEKIGGPSSKNYQPPGLWRELAHQKDNSKFTAQIFEQASGDDLYRRGMYTFWKRSVPPPNLVTFDAPNRETCVVRRETTNTPLQALVLLNDPTFVEASRWLAQRMILEADSTPERVRLGFLLATSREPTETELRILIESYDWHQSEFNGDESAALELLAVGDSDREESIPAAEHAAWTCVASLILNLDETITKE